LGEYVLKKVREEKTRNTISERKCIAGDSTSYTGRMTVAQIHHTGNRSVKRINGKDNKKKFKEAKRKRQR